MRKCCQYCMYAVTSYRAPKFRFCSVSVRNARRGIPTQPVPIETGSHLFPSRTQKLSPFSSKVLPSFRWKNRTVPAPKLSMPKGIESLFFSHKMTWAKSRLFQKEWYFYCLNDKFKTFAFRGKNGE